MSGSKFIILLAALVFFANASVAADAPEPDSPQSLGFKHYYKCPNDRDVKRIGDMVTAAACLEACSKEKKIAGCWWLDGTGGFPRECRVCLTLKPNKQVWPNDWAQPMNGLDQNVSLPY